MHEAVAPLMASPVPDLFAHETGTMYSGHEMRSLVPIEGMIHVLAVTTAPAFVVLINMPDRGDIHRWNMSGGNVGMVDSVVGEDETCTTSNCAHYAPIYNSSSALLQGDGLQLLSDGVGSMAFINRMCGRQLRSRNTPRAGGNINTPNDGRSATFTHTACEQILLIGFRSVREGLYIITNNTRVFRRTVSKQYFSHYPMI